MRWGRRFLGLAVSAAVAGCGGSGPIALGTHGDVSGVVIDQAGYVVPGASVKVDDNHATRSNPSGVYVLSDLPESTVTLQADATRDNVHLTGQGKATVKPGVRVKDVNITLAPGASP